MFFERVHAVRRSDKFHTHGYRTRIARIEMVVRGIRAETKKVSFFSFYGGGEETEHVVYLIPTTRPSVVWKTK